ncbi:MULTISPECIES: alpha-1,4-glucan--maltose-1-phosphate maltosyltransferase [unclassified Robiginitalea]|uniref:alpha-1,4-glucan--maltose-1-phosphate maltosyltransferase n=1 Tax=Robiginitalea TaxID=252306 RepID=UPI00234AEAFE|nr:MULTISPECIES: alpha-1,4-glucan--maltose-1-phosphate maltosyltransferase [unclassified Robiginitalea]MDC6353688.1 alpha-1,4-glucan--maltose-1-phosphate maltosyltransferase [Robiginitalea sp. PM2]MDC6375762.1 alpha-1,4-glucan--maltose-1-phosphate maltosyltransferase [Robiginitalea sp. SP8]
MFRQERVVIDAVRPQLDCGKFFIKRVVGDTVEVSADILPDGHDVMQAEVLYKHQSERRWDSVRMLPLENDRYQASFTVAKQGFYQYKVRGWVDYALNWQHGIGAKIRDGQHVRSELLDGVQYLEHLAKDAGKADRAYARDLIPVFEDAGRYDQAVEAAVSDRLHELFMEHPERRLANTTEPLEVYVDRKKAEFSTWYEFFPRSASPTPGKHGTFADCERLLPRIAEMGFDTVYFPPIHPIGEKNRKGKNNTTEAEDGDCGVPWAIGSRHGGHRAIHPELGTEEDFRQLVRKAGEHGLEIAMDLAFQAAPDHPYIAEHPEWFRKRPDGTMQYAENPPKKYQDIVNFYFETPAYKALWKELLEVTLQWVGFGVTIFRVDNPHTKPYYFWNWLIAEVKKKHPDVLFLAEAFSRPRIMQQLAKQGFSQSYTYFTWREHKQELIDYMVELTQTDMREYYRPNFWPNTPDINPHHLQNAGEAIHLIRYGLAATLSGNIGIYGPVFEYMANAPLPGKEEYLDCEKYEIRHWDWGVKNKLTHVISKVNAIRREHPALQQTNNIYFCGLENPQMLAYYKWDHLRQDEILVVISLDQFGSQSGFVRIPWEAMGPDSGGALEVVDLMTQTSYRWDKEWNYAELHPGLPFHIFHIRR